MLGRVTVRNPRLFLVNEQRKGSEKMTEKLGSGEGERERERKRRMDLDEKILYTCRRRVNTLLWLNLLYALA